MARFALRVSLPDRPGRLGRIASVLGEADVNIVTLEVLGPDRGGVVADLLVVDSPTPSSAALREVVERVEGAVVESVQPVPRRAVPDAEPLDLMAQLVRRRHEALDVLVDRLPSVLQVDWAVALTRHEDGHVDVLAASPGAPGMATLGTPWLPLNAPRLLVPAPWVPAHWRVDPVRGSMAAAALGDRAAAALVVRAGGPPLRHRDLHALETLAEVAGTLRPAPVSA